MEVISMNNDEQKEKFFFNVPILLVDDEEHFLNAMYMTLTSEKFINVDRCNDSREVIPLLKKKWYSLILLDILMPHIRGDVLLSQILEEQPGVKVIMVTAIDDVKIAVKCNGASDYLVKPVENFELIEKVKEILSALEPPLDASRQNQFNPKEEVKTVIKKAKEKLKTPRERNYKSLTVFLADLVGSTSGKTDYGHDKGMLRIHYHNKLAAETIKKFEGEVIKYIGDGVLAVFKDNTFNAIKAAIAFRDALTAIENDIKLPMKSCITLTYGQVEELEIEGLYDIGGQEVDKAARLQKEAKPGQILADYNVKRNAKLDLQLNPYIKTQEITNKNGRKLKGLDEPVRIIEITT